MRVAWLPVVVLGVAMAACASTPPATVTPPSSATTAAEPQAETAPVAPALPPPELGAGDPDFVPQVGQEGKDVVWVPTSPELVEVMLDLANVTPQDFVMDLGSGDGRNIIAAARRGARGLGVEYNPDMVALSQRMAREAGVADRARFIQGDMYVADISQATVLALFLLPENLLRLKDNFLALRPGTRIVMNTFTLDGWEPAVTRRLEDGCSSWCNALLLIVPAKVDGRWRLDGAGLELSQEYEALTGTIVRDGAQPVGVSGRIRADELTLTIDGRTYAGRVSGDRITGTVTEPSGATRAWTATR